MKIHRRVTKFLLFFVLFQTAPFTTHAAQEAKVDLTEMTLEQLMNIEVNAATKTAIPEIQVPQAVTVLSRLDIERIPANNLAELLRLLVGSNVVKAQSSQNILGSRGSNPFSPSKILILVDGQPIDPTLFAATWWELVPVSIPDIERIEFVRSPGTIYGSNAQNGVINIVTQKIGLEKGDQHKLRLRAKLGQQNLQQEYVGLLGKFHNVSYRLSTELAEVYAYRNTERLQIVPGRLSGTGEQTFDTHRKMLDLQNFSGGVETSLFHHPLTATFGLTDIHSAQGRFPDRLCFVGIDGGVGYGNVNYSFESFGAKHSLTVGTDLIHYTILKNSDSEKLAPAKMSVNKLNFGYELKKPVSAQHNLLWGVSYALETASNASGTGSINEPVNFEPIATSYVQDDWKITDRDDLYFGGLFSSHYISGSTFSPLLALVHKLNDRNILRMATFTSYRNPNVFEHSMDYDQFTGSSTKRTHLISNSHLGAERTTSYEMGFRSEVKPNLFFSIDFYFDQIKNGIEWRLVGVDLVPTARPRYQSENNLSQKVGGVEATVHYRFGKYWSVENNFSATTISNRSSRREYQGREGRGVNGVGQGRYGAEYVPAFIDGALLQFDRGRAHANFQYQYSAAHTWQWPSWSPATGLDQLQLKPVPGYGILNAYFGIDLTKNLGLAIESYNLADNHHTEWRGDESYFGREVRAVINITADSTLLKRSRKR